jgi:hypothetical protein
MWRPSSRLHHSPVGSVATHNSPQVSPFNHTAVSAGQHAALGGTLLPKKRFRSEFGAFSMYTQQSCGEGQEDAQSPSRGNCQKAQPRFKKPQLSNPQVHNFVGSRTHARAHIHTTLTAHTARTISHNHTTEYLTIGMFSSCKVARGGSQTSLE